MLCDLTTPFEVVVISQVLTQLHKVMQLGGVKGFDLSIYPLKTSHLGLMEVSESKSAQEIFL